MARANGVIRGVVAVGALVSAIGCAPTSYQVRAPSPSGLAFRDVGTAAVRMSVRDARKESEKVFSKGRLPANLSVGDQPIDPPRFLAAQLEQELRSRGIQAEVGTAEGDVRLDLHRFNVLNQRTSGFSPFVTLTFLSADLTGPEGAQRIGVFVKRGKVPVWSFGEVVEPTFNQPLSLVVKELASKIAKLRYGYMASDGAVDELQRKIAARSAGGDTYLEVYALGFTNNPRAIPAVASLVDDPDEYVRLAAVSSLGTLGASSHFDMLRARARNRDGLWQDRAMAIKAIGDLGTPEARKFLQEELEAWQGARADNEASWTSQIIRLYL